MPAKRKAKPPVVPDIIPEYVQQTRTYQRRKVTKRKLPSFTEAMYLLHVPELAREYFKALLGGLKDRDKTSLEHVGEMLTYVQRKGFSINVAQQMLQQNAVAGPESPVIGFDAFARQLAEARAGHALPMAPEVKVIEAVRPADGG